MYYKLYKGKIQEKIEKRGGNMGKKILGILFSVSLIVAIFFTSFEDFKLKIDKLDNEYIDLINNNDNKLDELFN